MASSGLRTSSKPTASEDMEYPEDAYEIPIQGWLTWLVGVTEEQVIASHRDSVWSPERAEFVNKTSGEVWPAGKFECLRVVELQTQVQNLLERSGAEPRPPVPLRVLDGIDIGRLQATLRSEDCAMVQIASNFNCLEVPGRGSSPDYGYLVEGYATDATQGPAASFGVPAASLLRAHYPFYRPGTPPTAWGQTAARQVELLAHVRDVFGTCVNGKVTLDGTEARMGVEQIDEVSNSIQVGLHMDAEVVFGRSATRGVLTVVPRPYPVVDQILTASVNWRSVTTTSGFQPPAEQVSNLTRAALRAAYNGAYLAAIARGRRLLLLTLIGGGCFGNPEDMILKEIAAAHAKWSRHPACVLEEVRLCLYPREEAARVDKALRELLA